ncbi:GM16056 [Drosophila sechellia]|uniref:GM16056 n=1 Tax=Drosophila sechellia TaxID=7238 RepID=B4I8V4_DROSE|nr:GM16056 [Drosophila sechellia]
MQGDLVGGGAWPAAERSPHMSMRRSCLCSESRAQVKWHGLWEEEEEEEEKEEEEEDRVPKRKCRHYLG